MESIRTLGRKLAGVLELIKFEHSIFALPFAVMSLFMVYGGTPDFTKTWWIIVCMVSARSASMSFNRIVDFAYDLKNPRTRERPLQTGKVSTREAWIFTVLMSLLFVASAWMLNRMAFILSFTTFPLLFGYSFTKRFFPFSHLILGLSLGLSPLGVWVAVTETLPLVSLLLCGGVTFWVAGFDVIYALQDVEFDIQEGLVSIPVRFGIKKALDFALLFHIIAVIFFASAGIAGHMGMVFYGGLILVTAFLCYEHLLVRKHGLSRINMAFFTINGVVSILFALFSVADIFIRKP
ncbi:MAG: 4-hydroxybenzoate octaprenyltransferase [Syntrophus sp. (in: bacteria)]|nr:4-hydroxybenzoate octaprenyltransferase [Syntrophus sp. (in: bacteria)]